MKYAKQLLCMLLLMVLMLSVSALPAAAANAVATPARSAMRINGAEQKLEAYCINGYNYFKLRDIAYALNGTAKQFQVSYDDEKSLVDLYTQMAYTVVGGELAVSGSTKSVAATPTPYDVYLDGVKVTLTAYVIGKSNYMKLRDIADAIDFNVTYDAASGTIEIDTFAGYTPDKQPDASTATSKDISADLNVTFIGDSIGISLAPYLKSYYPNIYVDSKVSRQFYEAKGIIQQLLKDNKLGSTVVIELGTNGTVKESDMRAVIDLIGDRKIVFVNCQVPRSWCEGNNKTIQKVCAEFPNACIADWYSASLNRSDYFAADKVHSSKTGAQVLAKLIADAIAEIQ